MMDGMSAESAGEIKAYEDTISNTAYELMRLVSPAKGAVTRDPASMDEDPAEASADTLILRASFGLLSLGIVSCALSPWSGPAPIVAVGILLAVVLLTESCFSRLTRRWMLRRMHRAFNRNKGKIHRMEIQLGKMVRRYRRMLLKNTASRPSPEEKEPSERVETTLRLLYDWYHKADLPMSDAMREIFKDEVEQDDEDKAVKRAEEQRRRRLEDSYSKTSLELQGMLAGGPQEQVGPQPECYATVSTVTCDGSRLVYDGPDRRLASLAGRINETARRMEEGSPGSGGTFVTEMWVPFESLDRLSMLAGDDHNNMEMAGLLHRSIEMFDKRLDREESKLAESRMDLAREEYGVLEGLLA